MAGHAEVVLTIAVGGRHEVAVEVAHCGHRKVDAAERVGEAVADRIAVADMLEEHSLDGSSAQITELVEEGAALDHVEDHYAVRHAADGVHSAIADRDNRPVALELEGLCRDQDSGGCSQLEVPGLEVLAVVPAGHCNHLCVGKEMMNGSHRVHPDCRLSLLEERHHREAGPDEVAAHIRTARSGGSSMEEDRQEEAEEVVGTGTVDCLPSRRTRSI